MRLQAPLFVECFRTLRPPAALPASMKKDLSSTILSPQQEAVLRQLLPIARIATSGNFGMLPVHPRTHTLMLGPSGSGKSHLAREIGRTFDVPTMMINVSSWVILSARNEPWTFSSICQWLDSLKTGGIIVLDEIDKLQGNTDWKSYIRLEIHDLLDGVIPLAARMPCPENVDPWDLASPASRLPADRAALAKRLRERVFVLGCGAWQSSWRGNSRKMGFSQGINSIEAPSREQILESIESEIRQRFRSQVCWLPPMERSDYLSVSSKMARLIQNPETRRVWNRLASPAIEEAVCNGLGMRIFEELMLSALLGTPDYEEPTVEDFDLPDV